VASAPVGICILRTADGVNILSNDVVETAFCTFVLSRIAGEIASILDGIPLSVQRRFPELENRHVDFLKRDIIKAMNKAAALDELIPGLLSEYIEQSG
ncbi:terminase small subunit, partial [Escherichia coli]|uniref:terminase small subunit n=1 Tax=Escherichia coli TaxID=562 RepID=UPI00201A7BA7